MSNEFVILLHTGHGPDHYDLMLSSGDSLATWQTARNPAGLAEGESVAARRLADHRREYLEYEGPVSKGRGRVVRREKGSYRLISRDERRWVIHLEGVGFSGRFELSQAGADDADWRLARRGD